MRHAEAVSRKHRVSVLHIISKPGVSKTEIEMIKEGDLATYIAYIPPSFNPIIKLIRFWNAYKNILKKIGSFDLVHLNKLYPFGGFALHLNKNKNYPLYHFRTLDRLSFESAEIIALGGTRFIKNNYKKCKFYMPCKYRFKKFNVEIWIKRQL